ncbi:MAG: DinB family protein [Planctomycetes bacterium]|nr:DinB family protein [Planctomycetota bacterium]
MHYDSTEATALLQRTPAQLDAWLRGLPDAWLRCDEGPGTWSPYVVVGHLVAGERTDWLPRVRHLLQHGESVPFPPFDREAQFARPAVPIGTLLDEFTALRGQSLAGLAALQLSPADLARRGRHPALGPVTLGQHLATWVAHDLTHTAQIARAMARRYRDDVGPWSAYLRIVREGPA